ncbi:hypothetical protein [Pseudarthrobacter sp. NKDBFgelt]|nr:hypothetical protein [Arthrobacter sp. S13_S34]
MGIYPPDDGLQTGKTAPHVRGTLVIARVCDNPPSPDRALGQSPLC